MKLYQANYEPAKDGERTEYGPPFFYVVAASLFEAVAKAETYHTNNPSIVKRVYGVTETYHLVTA